MKRNLSIILSLALVAGIIGGAIANPDRALVGTVKLSAGKAKKDLTGTLASIFAGNSSTIGNGRKTIKVYGASDDDLSGDRVRAYGFDLSNNQVGTYFFSILFTTNISNVTSKTVTPASTVGNTIAFRPNYAGGVRFLSATDMGASAGFANNSGTVSDGNFELRDRAKLFAPNPKNGAQKVTGVLSQDVPTSSSGSAPVTGRFALTLTADDVYNDFNP